MNLKKIITLFLLNTQTVKLYEIVSFLIFISTNRQELPHFTESENIAYRQYVKDVCLALKLD